MTSIYKCDFIKWQVINSFLFINFPFVSYGHTCMWLFKDNKKWNSNMLGIFDNFKTTMNRE